MRPLNDLTINDFGSNSFAIYPNPTENQFTMDVSDDLIGMSFSLIDMSGRVLFSSIITELSTKVNSSILENGMYQLIITGKNGEKIARKLLK